MDVTNNHNKEEEEGNGFQGYLHQLQRIQRPCIASGEM